MKEFYITVLDYGMGGVYIYKQKGDIKTTDCEEAEATIDKKGHRLSDCYWMSSDNLCIHSDINT